jgi:hypothetical protein
MFEPDAAAPERDIAASFADDMADDMGENSLSYAGCTQSFA